MVLNEGMKARDFAICERDDREWRRERVVDEPAQRGVLFHPLKKADNIRLHEMMREEGADDDVERLGGRVREYVRAAQRMRLPGGVASAAIAMASRFISMPVNAI